MLNVIRNSLTGARRRTVGNVAQGDYVAKQKVTLWNYGNGGNTLIPYNVPEKVELEVKLEDLFRYFY